MTNDSATGTGTTRIRQANTPGAQATPREWAGLAVLGLGSLLVSIDVFVLLLALPAIATQLDASATEQLWIMDVYGFLLVGFMLTAGTLGDRIGRRKLLLIGSAGFAVASVLAAFSVSAGMLIAARALLGIAGATLAPSTLGLISTMFRDEKQRGVAIGVWMILSWAVRPSDRSSVVSCWSTFGGVRCSCSGCRQWCCCSSAAHCCSRRNAIPAQVGSTLRVLACR